MIFHWNIAHVFIFEWLSSRVESSRAAECACGKSVKAMPQKESTQLSYLFFDQEKITCSNGISSGYQTLGSYFIVYNFIFILYRKPRIFVCSKLVLLRSSHSISIQNNQIWCVPLVFFYIILLLVFFSLLTFLIRRSHLSFIRYLRCPLLNKSRLSVCGFAYLGGGRGTNSWFLCAE